MKKILAFAGSNSPESINQKLAEHAAALLHELPSTIINLRDFPMPLFGLDVESAGIPENAVELRRLVEEHDAFIIAVSENNHSVSAVFKNTMDWLSRAGAGYDVFQNKPMLLLGTSPGGGGASFAIKHAEDILTLLKGDVTDSYALRSFYKNAEVKSEGLRITNEQIESELHELVKGFENRLTATVVRVEV